MRLLSLIITTSVNKKQYIVFTFILKWNMYKYVHIHSQSRTNTDICTVIVLTAPEVNMKNFNRWWPRSTRKSRSSMQQQRAKVFCTVSSSVTTPALLPATGEMMDGGEGLNRVPGSYGKTCPLTATDYQHTFSSSHLNFAHSCSATLHISQWSYTPAQGTQWIGFRILSVRWQAKISEC